MSLQRGTGRRAALAARLGVAFAMSAMVSLASGVVQADDTAPAGAATAERTSAPPALAVLPGRTGYAFDNPEVLARQRLFGLVHGVNLLVSACLGRAQFAEATQAAYDDWQGKQAAAITPLFKALARHYYGERARDARWQDVAGALGLKETIHPSLGNTSLDDACATLPEALARPRYDIAAQAAALGLQ